jgi:hypothetical protein
LDAKKQEIKIDDEPCINVLKLIKAFEKLASFIEDNAGFTLLTMPKKTSLNTLKSFAKQHKITVTDISSPSTLNSQGNDYVIETYRMLIANDFFKDGLVLSPSDEKLFEIPTIQELLAADIWRTILGKKSENEADRKQGMLIGTSSGKFEPTWRCISSICMLPSSNNTLFITNGNENEKRYNKKLIACYMD